MTVTPPPGAPEEERALPLARRIVRARGAASLFFRRRATSQRLPMVGWYDPGQLLDTGLKTLFSMIVGERSDRRIIQALAARQPDVYDYTHHYVEGDAEPSPAPDRPREELWLDYVADTGDGWNSTYAVAWALAQPTLALPDGSALPRADVLVFGGDQVYPAASREEYNRRLVVPFDTALGDAAVAESPHVFAIPGNHDWYDGLVSFTRLFCQKRRIGAWKTLQRGSYFAFRLPHGLWLFAVDIQLEADIDLAQLAFFCEIVEKQM
ncbi:MAG TPA: metallophosphoesterase, partial [Gemmatimonadales bacterium]|nr:metallophosphoesterase [Gemmatimonadales bacterium]